MRTRNNPVGVWLMGIQCNAWSVQHVHQKEAGAERENNRTRVGTYLAFITFFACYINFTVHLPRRLRIVVIGHLDDDVILLLLP